MGYMRKGGADCSSDVGINETVAAKAYINKPYKVRITNLCGYEKLNSFETAEEAIKFAQSFNKPIKDMGNNLLMIKID